MKKNKGAGGADGVTIARFDESLEHYLDVLHRQLKDGRYRPRPVKRVETDKPGTTNKCPLGIPWIGQAQSVLASAQQKPASSRATGHSDDRAALAAAVRSLARFDPTVVRRTVPPAGWHHLHVGLIDLGRFLRTASR